LFLSRLENEKNAFFFIFYEKIFRMTHLSKAKMIPKHPAGLLINEFKKTVLPFGRCASIDSDVSQQIFRPCYATETAQSNILGSPLYRMC